MHHLHPSVEIQVFDRNTLPKTPGGLCGWCTRGCIEDLLNITHTHTNTQQCHVFVDPLLSPLFALSVEKFGMMFVMAAIALNKQCQE